MDFTFSSETEMLRATARGYVQKFLKPLEKSVEEQDFLDDNVFRELWMEAVKLGLYAHRPTRTWHIRHPDSGSICPYHQ